MRFLPLLLLAGCLVEGRVGPAVPDRPPPPVYVAPAEPAPTAPPPDVAPPAPVAQPPEYSADVQAEPPPPAPPGADVESEAAFDEPLAAYGSWTAVEGYGRVWVPHVAYGWRPYYYGRWVLTDWGWTFVSDDPWGWAAYHYGRWNWGLGVGWYWIPGRTWGPAWVQWRYGGGYVSWAPLGPRGVVFGVNHPAWIAVGEGHFTEPIVRVAVVGPRAAGFVRVGQPLPVARPIRGGVFGPPVARISAATGRPLAAVPVARAINPQRPVAGGPVAGPVMRSPARPAPVARPQGAPVSHPPAVRRAPARGKGEKR